VLALDGATFDVLEPLARSGRAPNLARWMEKGVAGPLPSVFPPVTFPAWSSFATGLAPGEHGLLDFTLKVPGEYRVRFANAADRAGTSLFRRVSAAGGRVLVLGIPTFYPPEPVSGLLVSGFDAPVSPGTDARSASDPELYRRIAATAGPWMRPDLDEGASEPGFHERALETLLSRVERKTRFAEEALRRMREEDGAPPDLAMVVFSESDTVGHHYWRDHDPASPRHDPAASPARRDAVSAVYQALDTACGRLRQAFGEDAACVVLSDHGMGGASRRVVHLNRFLEGSGWLVRRRAGWDRLARRARDTALRCLPPGAAQAVFRRTRRAAARLESAARFGGIDWRRTVAFSEESNTLPGIWVNLEGREARGCVAPADYERVRDELIAALRAWRLPEEPGLPGGPVVTGAWRREEVLAGPRADRAPDVLFELALEGGYGPSLVPTPWAEEPPDVRTLGADELAGGRGRGMNGTHRRDGIWISHGPGAPAPPPRLDAAAPALLATLGLDPGLDAGLDPGLGPGVGAPRAAPESRPYSADEDEQVERRLRALGYLE